MITFPQLKAAADAITKEYNISEDNARKIIAHYNQTSNKALSDVVNGDLSSVPAVADSLGIMCGSSGAEKKSSNTAKPGKGTKKKKETPEPLKANNGIETVQGEVLTDSEELPEGTAENIEIWLDEFSQKYDIDLLKCSGMQWRSACIFIGQHIKKSGMLIDRAKQKRQGGTPYKPERIEKILYIWEYLTGLYKHVPLACDFVSFSGISNEYYHDTEKRLSSSQVDLWKKAREIEERALSSAICDSKENPTGRIYYTKARLGWRESVEVIHTTAASVGTLDDIPKLTDING